MLDTLHMLSHLSSQQSEEVDFVIPTPQAGHPKL